MLIPQNLFIYIIHARACLTLKAPIKNCSRRHFNFLLLCFEDGSDEGSQHKVSMKNNKKFPSNIIKYALLSRAPTISSNTEIKRDYYSFCLSIYWTLKLVVKYDKTVIDKSASFAILGRASAVNFPDQVRFWLTLHS